MIFLVGFLIISTAYAAWLDKMERKWYGVKHGVYLEEQLVEGFLPPEVDMVIDELVPKHRVMPRDPYIDRKTGRIVPETIGYDVNERKTKNMVMSSPPDQRLKLVLTSIEPNHRAVELAGVNRMIGSYSTWFYGSWQRHQNIMLALASLNHTIIWPGETISFNEIVGPRTPERGYRLAPVIGGDGLGFGGGVCQVSTTLFNAAVNADLTIVERHPHSTPVPYVPVGKDATVVFGAQDLIIKNKLETPVIIKAGIDRGKIMVTILGK